MLSKAARPRFPSRPGVVLQHIKETNSSVSYFVSGAVDIVDPSTKHVTSVPKNSLQFYWADILGLGGFATVEADPLSMTLRYHNALGRSLYKYEMKARK